MFVEIIDLANASYKTVENSNITNYVDSYFSAVRINNENNDVTEIKVNGNNVNVYKEIIPCSFDSTNQCVLEIKSDTERLKCILKLNQADRVSEDVTNDYADFNRRFYELFGYDDHYVSEIVHAIRCNELSLFSIVNPLVRSNSGSLLDEIAKVMGMIMDICSKPKNSLKKEEIILDVELVKRFNPSTLRHLSAHSEHWKNKTLSGIIPSRLKAEIFEEEVNIYENLFFRMAVNDIYIYVHRLYKEYDKYLKNNTRSINWERYGTKLKDYKRGEFFRQLLPTFDFSQKESENGMLYELIEKCLKLEKQFSSIMASSFFRSLDKNKRITLPVHQTNIIKMDSRYNALFHLWNEVNKINLYAKQLSELVMDKDVNMFHTYYESYVITVLVYALSLLGCEDYGKSMFLVKEDGNVSISASYKKGDFLIHVNSSIISTGHSVVEIQFVENAEQICSLPQKCKFESVDRSIYEDIFWIDENNKIHILRKPNAEEERQIQNIFKINKSSSKFMPNNEKRQTIAIDKEWRLFWEDIMRKFPQPREHFCILIPVFSIISPDKGAIVKYCENLFKIADNEVISYFFALPLDLDEYSDKADDESASLLLNYGEAHVPKNAGKWGNYKVGLIPIAKSEIYSTQRLLKMVSLTLTKLAIEWGIAENRCPVCSSSDIQKYDATTWECRNQMCNIIWGTTTCANGCGKKYKWIRPKIQLDIGDLVRDVPINERQNKESVFDRLTITDFKIEEEGQKYVPICPLCGKP